MADYQSLCEYLAACGGIRLVRPKMMFAAGGPDRLAHGAGDLISMAADAWHKSRPFQRKLVRENEGRPLDDACIWAFEGGYFYSLPSTNELLDAIERELGGKPFYRGEDEAAMFEAEERKAIQAEQEHAGAATVPEIIFYERPFVTKKGRAGVSYYAKIAGPAARKPLLHTVFSTAGEREAAVQAFLATRAPVDAGCPF